MATAHDLNNEQLRHTVQRQTDTIESLNAAAVKYRTRLASLEQQLVVKQAELDSLRVLVSENSSLREQNAELREHVRALEQTSSRLTEQSSLGAESHAQLGVKLQAYQRHNNFLQGEVALRESKVKAQQEKIDVLTEELHSKDRRVSILVEKLRQHNIDPNTTVHKVSVPEDVLAQMKQKLLTQGATIDLLHEKLESSQDETSRREMVVQALQKENAALRGSVSRLIAQISGSTRPSSASPQRDGAGDGVSPMDANGSGGSPPSHGNDLEAKLRRFQERRSAS